jgi:uncharacterized repeat protein (TIGR03833 family)
MHPTPRGSDRGRGTDRGRGDFRGRGRGRGRGTPNRPRGSTFNTATQTHTPPPQTSSQYNPNRAYSSVPPHRLIHPETPVSIILKADQPTGHQVSGIVADLLTRGDHPRGVKVRLRDGRVGRVQRIVSVEEGERGEGVVGGAGANLGRDGAGSSRGGGFGMRGGRMERDIREEDDYLYDESKVVTRNDGLFGALEEADQRWREQSGGGKKEHVDVVVCPVCAEFEGDERAVAHHVEGHFGE